MVTAAPPILIVAPSGIEIEYVSFSRPSLRHRLMFTGMFAAELLVKNPVMALSRNTVNTSGYGFWRMAMNTMSGFKTNATKSIQPIKSIKDRKSVVEGKVVDFVGGRARTIEKMI